MTSHSFIPQPIPTLLSYSLFAAAATVFIGYAYLTVPQLDTDSIKEKMIKQEKVHPLNLWSLSVTRCLKGSPSTCQEELTMENFAINHRASAQALLQKLHRHPRAPQTAKYKISLSYKLPFSTLAWLKENPYAFFVAPSFSGSNLRMTEPTVHPWRVHHRADYIISLDEKILNTHNLTLQIVLHPDAETFGSVLMPPALVQWDTVQEYADLDQKKSFVAYMHRPRNIIMALIIATLVLVLNHSFLSLLLSYIAVILACRTLLSTLYENVGWQYQELIAIPLIFLISINFVFLIRIILYLMNRPLKARTVALSCALATAINLMLFYPLQHAQSLFYVALYNDSISTALGFLLALIGAVFPSTFCQPPHPEDLSTSSLAAQRRSILLTCVLLGLISASSLPRTLGFESPYPTSLHAWFSQLLVPALFCIILVRLGSIVNTIKKVSLIVKAKTEIDRDIEIGKELQSGILPEKKHKTSSFCWHAFYYPASHLAGDWFDLREITSKDGRALLLGCVVDVTGHGISSAMMTSNIASHWGLWCLSLQNSEITDDHEERQQLLSTAPRQIHRGLIGLRYNLGCSMAVIMYEPESHLLTYLTAGHPGIIVTEGTNFSYLTSRGTRPGTSAHHDLWTARSLVLPQKSQQIILYTDGIVKEGTAIPVWLKQIRRKSSEEQRSPTHYITSQLRSSRREARRNPGKEDDLTLLIIKITGPESADKTHDEEWQRVS